MKNTTKSNIGRIFISVLCCVPFIALWYYIALAVSVAYSEGAISVFKDSFGNWIVYLGVILSIVVFSSIVYLRFFIKKEWLVHLTAYLLTGGLIVAGLIVGNAAASEFKEFSTDKWIEFPAQRITMFFDLVERYDVKGYTEAEIEELLGKPDSVSDDGTYVYDDMHNNAVYVEFENEVVYDIYFIE